MIASGVLVVVAVAALVASPDPTLARSVGVAVVLVCIGLGVLLRQRERAGRAAAELAATRRLRAEERFEEQLAEAEYAAEVAEERATRFGRRLTAEKSRLAKAETEIARLLRERAVMVAAQALKDAEAAQKALAETRPKYPASPAAFVRAASVLRQLERAAERAEQRRESTARAEVAVRPAPQLVPQLVPVASPTSTAVQVGPSVLTPAPAVPAPAVATAPAPAAPVERAGIEAVPLRPVLAASVEPLGGVQAAAIVPAGRQRPRPQAAGRAPGFSFFGRAGAAGAAMRAAAPSPAVGDLADVLGDEALAETARYTAPGAPAPEAKPEHTRPEVVDLTPEDDTVGLEVSELRANHR